MTNKFKDYSNNNLSEITVEESTVLAYNKKAEQLRKRAIKELNLNSDDIDPRQFVIWLLDNRHTINKNSYRVYKSSVISYLTNTVKTPIALDAAQFLIRKNSDFSYTKSNKTSAKKSKRINQNDLDKLISYLDNNDNKWNSYIKCWLLGGILCGLRPSEWKDAEIIKYGMDDDTHLALKVKNAKNTNGRANGDYRILLLTDLNEDELNIIKQQIYNIKLFDKAGQYDRFYNDCIVQLNTANKAVFGNRNKNITLYSARHQFSANAKFSNKTKAEVAALMGHAVDATATIHYGKKQFGKTKIGVQPIQEQVNSVKQKPEDDFYINKIANYQKKDLKDVNVKQDNINHGNKQK